MTSRIRIAPSILAADFARLGEEVRAMQDAGADYVHIDVMDGHFVPNLTLGPVVVKALRPHTTLPFDVHLMIAPVDPYVAAFAEAGADIITVHPESGAHLHRTIQLIKGCGRKAGVSLNPATPVAAIEHVIGDIDLILVMSVNPGFGGQAFIPAMFDKIAEARRRIDRYSARTGRAIRLQVDGGIKPDNIRAIATAGADTFVVGSGIFSARRAQDPNGYDDVIARLGIELARSDG